MDAIFLALSDCAALHPDTFSDEEGDGELPEGVHGSNGDAAFHFINGNDLDMAEGEWYTENSNNIQLSEAGQATLRRLEDVLDMPLEGSFEGRFEDSSYDGEHK